MVVKSFFQTHRQFVPRNVPRVQSLLFYVVAWYRLILQVSVKGHLTDMIAPNLPMKKLRNIWQNKLYKTAMKWNCNRSLWVWARPMRDDDTSWHRLSLAEPIPTMIPDKHSLAVSQSHDYLLKLHQWKIVISYYESIKNGKYFHNKSKYIKTICIYYGTSKVEDYRTLFEVWCYHCFYMCYCYAMGYFIQWFYHCDELFVIGYTS